MAELSHAPDGTPFRTSGEGAPPFVFLGPLDGAPRWAAQIANVSRDRLCIELAASNPDAIEEVLGTLRPGPVVIAAAEQDAMTALQFCELFPEAVTGLVLLNPPLPPDGEELDVSRAQSLVKLADKKPFMIVWPESPAGDPGWLRDVTMFVRQEPVAGAPGDPRTEQPDITNALLRAFIDDVKNDPRLS